MGRADAVDLGVQFAHRAAQVDDDGVARLIDGPERALAYVFLAEQQLHAWPVRLRQHAVLRDLTGFRVGNCRWCSVRSTNVI